MPFSRGLTSKNLFSSVFVVRRKKEKDCYLKNGSSVLEELLALCDGNCRIPIRYFSAIEINNAIKHSKTTIMEFDEVNMVTGSLDNRPVLVRFNTWKGKNMHRDIAITAQMSHLKNVLRLVGCCLEFEQPVMVYQYVEGISLSDLLFIKDNLIRKSLLSWGNRLRIANEVASAIVFLHTEFTTPIIHTNLMPQNVIIDQKSGVSKILDFSVSISLPPGELEVQVDRIYGTLRYMAPEYAMRGIITQKIDVYSFGVLLFELLTGKNVYDIMKRVDSTNSKERIDFEEDAKSNTEEDNTLDKVDSTTSKERIDFEEDAKSNTEEDNTLDKVDSTTSKERIDFEEDAKSSTEEGSTLDRVDSKETIYIELVDGYIKEGNVMDLADPIILEKHGTEIQQQLHDCFDLVKKCTVDDGDDRPDMIHVARELCRIEKCFRALTLGQN